MDKLMNPKQVLVALKIDYFDTEQVINWAIEFFKQNPIDNSNTLVEIITTNVKDENELARVVDLLRQYIDHHYPNYQVNDNECVEFARQLFYERLNTYLIDDKLLLYDIHTMVSSIESFYDYPSWLGDIYHACDWVEPTSTKEDFPQLAEEIKRILSSINTE